MAVTRIFLTRVFLTLFLIGVHTCLSVPGTAREQRSKGTSVPSRNGGDVVAQFKKRFEKLKSLRFEYLSEEFLSPGKVLIREGNLFRIEVPDKTIVCDGKTLWNIDRQKNTVVITDYKPDAAGVSVDKLFGLLRSDLGDPIVSKVKESNHIAFTSLRYNLSGDIEKQFGVSKVVFFLSQIKGDLGRVELVSGGQDMKIQFVTFLTNVPTKVSDFTYSIPKTMKVVDLR